MLNMLTFWLSVFQNQLESVSGSQMGSGDPEGGPRQFVIVHGFHTLSAIKHLKVKSLSGDQMVDKI